MYHSASELMAIANQGLPDEEVDRLVDEADELKWEIVHTCSANVLDLKAKVELMLDDVFAGQGRIDPFPMLSLPYDLEMMNIRVE